MVASPRGSVVLRRAWCYDGYTGRRLAGDASQARTPVVRIVVVVLIVLALAALLYVGFEPPATSRGGSGEADDQAPGDCRACHEAAWREWAASYHARSWSDVSVQAAFRHFGFDRKCESCHAAQPVLGTGLAQAPELRDGDRASGVNCLTCHLLAGGRGVAAARTLPEAPCRPVETPGLAAALCGACHTAIYGDWKASRYAAEGRSCADCHMPAAQRGGRSHLCLGGHDEATVRSGARMECRQEGDELVVTVANHATGHNFPGERHQRVLLVQVIQRDVAGRIVLARQELIKVVTPFRGETSDEKIRAGESVAYRFPIADPPCTADVKLLYKPFPWVSDSAALVVVGQVVNLPQTGG